MPLLGSNYAVVGANSVDWEYGAFERLLEKRKSRPCSIWLCICISDGLFRSDKPFWLIPQRCTVINTGGLSGLGVCKRPVPSTNGFRRYCSAKLYTQWS